MKIFLVVVFALTLVIGYASLSHGVDAVGLSIAATLVLGIAALALARIGRRSERPTTAAPPADLAEAWSRLFRGYDVRKYLFGMAFLGYALALHHLIVPDITLGTGRWGWLKNLFMDWLGPEGPAVLSLIVATAVLICAFRMKPHSQNTD